MRVTGFNSPYEALENNEYKKNRSRNRADQASASNHKSSIQHPFQNTTLLFSMIPLVESLIKQLSMQDKKLANEQSCHQQDKVQELHNQDYSAHQVVSYDSSSLNMIRADDLYETVENSLNQKATEARVRYNAGTGRPEYIYLDLDRRVTAQKKATPINRYYALYVISPPKNTIDLDGGQKAKEPDDVIFPNVLEGNPVKAPDIQETSDLLQQKNENDNADLDTINKNIRPFG